MGKPKGMYIHPHEKRQQKRVGRVVVSVKSVRDNKEKMREFLRGKR